MAYTKAMLLVLMALTVTPFCCIRTAADHLVAPNSLSDGQSLKEGEWTFSNQGCTLRLAQNGEAVIVSGGVDGTCFLTMRTDGELVLARDSDGFVVYTSDTVSVLGGVIDSYMLHLGNDGTLAIERSDTSVILQLH